MRMRDLINGELGEVRLRTGAKPVPEHVGLADLLDEITATTRHEAKKSDIQFTEEVDHQLELDTDPQLLISVVFNIELMPSLDAVGRSNCLGRIKRGHR